MAHFSCRFIFILGYLTLFITTRPLMAAEVSTDDVARHHLTKYLKADDPLKKPVNYSANLEQKSLELVSAVRSGDWNNSLLRQPVAFELVRYAYMNQVIDKYEFIDIQDYLQIQADFASPETIAFDKLLKKKLLPVRTHALSVKRIHYSKIDADLLPKMYRNPKAADHLDQFGWVTEVVLSYDLFIKYAYAIADTQCSKTNNANVLTCLGHNLSDKTLMMIQWLFTLENILPEQYTSTLLSIRSGENLRFYLGSVPLHLLIYKTSNSPDFIPIFGQLDWSDLNKLRKNNRNPGTIYHPRILTNYFYPHGIYGGTSAFMRHDIYHQKELAYVPQNYRDFFIWLHAQEILILAEMDKSFHKHSSQNFPMYDETMKPSSNSILTQICSYQQTQISYEKSTVISSHLWPRFGQHDTLFQGVFADMDHIIRANSFFYGFLNWATPDTLWWLDPDWEQTGVFSFEKTLVNMLSSQCQYAGFNFELSFKIYHSELEKLLNENKDLIHSQFGISVDDLLLKVKELLDEEV